MSFTASTDIPALLAQCRAAISTGNKNQLDVPKLIQAILWAGGEFGTGLASTADTLADSTATLKGVIDAQFAILNAFTGGDSAADIVAAIATANTTIGAAEATVESLRVVEETVNPTPFFVVPNDTMDGVPAIG